MFNVGDRVTTFNRLSLPGLTEGIVKSVHEDAKACFVVFDEDPDNFFKAQGHVRYFHELQIASPEGPEEYEEWFKS